MIAEMESLNSDIKKQKMKWFFSWVFYFPTIGLGLSYQVDYERISQINILSSDFSFNLINAHLYKETNKNS